MSMVRSDKMDRGSKQEFPVKSLGYSYNLSDALGDINHYIWGLKEVMTNEDEGLIDSDFSFPLVFYAEEILKVCKEMRKYIYGTSIG